MFPQLAVATMLLQTPVDYIALFLGTPPFCHRCLLRGQLTSHMLLDALIDKGAGYGRLGFTLGKLEPPVLEIVGHYLAVHRIATGDRCRGTPANHGIVNYRLVALVTPCPAVTLRDICTQHTGLTRTAPGLGMTHALPLPGLSLRGKISLAKTRGAVVQHA